MSQNEHTIWLRKDAHSGAYKTLLGKRSQAIARNLGLAGAAHEASECLDCHSDNAQQRAGTHHLEEGVSCEACHGGAEPWLKSHVSRERQHGDNLAQGLYPADQAVARAQLCISCHFGNARKFVSHRMMGAGHPRLRFELDTYGIIQPPHFVADVDYRSRGKEVPTSAKLWAVGQVVSAHALLDVIADPSRNRSGIWAEFAVLDCYTCHHSMETYRRPVRRATGLQTHPGFPRLNDSALIMAALIFAELDPPLAERLVAETRALHAALGRGVGDRAKVAARMRDQLTRGMPRLEGWEISTASVSGLAARLIGAGERGEFRDYPAAEQAMQGLQALIATLDEIAGLDPARVRALDLSIKKMGEATRDENRFRSRAFMQAIAELGSALEGGPW